MARFDPDTLPPGKITWDPDFSGVGYRRRRDGKGGSWVIRYWVTLASGVRARKPETPLNCPNRAQAVNLLRARQGADFQGTYTERATGPTLTDFHKQFLEAKRNLETVDKYERQLRLHILPRLGDTPLNALTPAQIEEYQRRRLEAGDAEATVRSEVMCIASLMSEARRARLTKNNPIGDTRIVKPDNERVRVLTLAEQERLLERAALMPRARYMHTLVLLMLNTAFRISHALRARWDELVELPDENGRSELYLTTVPDKKARPVKIPMRHELRAELDMWRPICGSAEWVFPSRNDERKPFTRHGVKDAWDKLLGLAEIDGLWAHDLRRTVITRLSAAGASPKEIMAITGQKTAPMVIRYDQPTIQRVRNALDRAIQRRPTQGEIRADTDMCDTEQDGGKPQH